MKKAVFILMVILFASCKRESDNTFDKPKTEASAKSPIDIGKNIFEGKGNCVACHKPDQKIIGPSIQDISKIYKAKKGSIVAFLQEESEPIVDPSQYAIMKTNFAITKSMSEEELKALEVYIYSFSK